MIDWGEIFEYDGINLLWKIKPCNSVNIGDVAGYYDNGYNWVVYKGAKYGVHRIIWEMHNGPIPKGYQIDHIDHNRSNNNINNLRCVKPKTNYRNRSINKNNKSGCTGVGWFKPKNKWRAIISVDGHCIYLGLFDDIKDAIEARRRAEIEYGFNPL
ncbi:HNH endonuclease [Escherichia coli]|uniref:HNH endonuclease n=1 Tax=Escherichia coli TaxID=562 RepID=UPI0010C25291|nr:HNH endonuclease [Escherichia coli]EFL9654207.1 hypothetical protein [Escherichia coli]EGQ0959119.1 hypothetical protein [Escherichia coli]EKE9508577.1 HNH endonuclease [Escherichia coli]EKP1503062.1 HNH endonuclease [Escherichia coli]MBB7043034.1 HNH endonuclease [Escherichia coli]